MEQHDELHVQFKETESNAETHTAKSWRGVSVQYSKLQLPHEYEFRWNGSSHYLAHHDLVLIDGEMEVLGEKPVVGGDLRDQMTYVPAGLTIEGWARPASRLNAFTVVCFDPNVMEEEFQTEFQNDDPFPQIYFKDDELGATMRKLGRLMADETRPAAKIYAETVGLTAALEMFRITQNTVKTAIAPIGGLAQSHARTVRDYIEENLAKDIGLDELAAVCGLTRFHFARAFKATFGEPPYRYLNKRRMELAKHMLLSGSLTISDVAFACGFKGAGPFGRSFKEIVGVTPLEFRRGV